MQFETDDPEDFRLDRTFDYVLLDSALADMGDIQACLECIGRVCDPTTRLVMSYYNALWEPVLRFASRVGLRRPTGQQNWLGPEETPVQFTDDPALAEAVKRAEEIELEGERLRVIRRADLLHETLRAASDPARRRSKRLQDLADTQALLEATPTLAQELSAEEHALLDRLPH